MVGLREEVQVGGLAGVREEVDRLLGRRHGVVRRGGGDIRSVKLTGSPVVMKQQMDDGAMMNARASRIDYDLPNDTIVLSGDAFVEQPGESSIRSERIVYNMRTGQVQSGGEGNGRVKLRLMPKNAQPATGSDSD